MAADKRHLHRYSAPPPTHRPTTLTELAILQKRHQFIRDDEADGNAASLGWEDRLAVSWYAKLFREYALCDLTHYETGGVAMRWRTESEVLDRIGELTCGSLQCKYHKPVDSPEDRMDDDDMRPLVPRELTPYQLNFQYEEQGKTKQALVKVVLCPKCKTKLTYKKDKEKKARQSLQERGTDAADSHRRRSSDAQDSHAAERRREKGRRSETGPAEGRSKSNRHRHRSNSPCRRDSQRSERESRSHAQSREDRGPQSSKHARRTVTTSLMGPYYDAILAGTKTWEGRTNMPRYATLRPDDLFIFHHAEDATKPAFTAEILEVEKFDTFRDMLEGREQDFLPGIAGLEEGVDVYKRIPGYRDQVREVGAAAFRIRVVERHDR